MKRLFTFILLSFISVQAWSLEVVISGGTESATPIAVVPFGWSGAGEQPVYNVGKIVAADLKRSGRFRTLPEQDMVSRPHSAKQVNLSDWRRLNQEYLVVGNVSSRGGKYQINFDLMDLSGKKLLSSKITSEPKDIRSSAHQISDLVYEKLTDERGAFNTRVAYITSLGRGQGRPKVALQVADADGHGAQTIVSSHDPIMSPAWSADGRRIAYVSFERGRPGIYIQEVFTGKRTKITSFNGINGAPAWSPDGNRLAMTLSKDGSPDIFIYDLSTGGLRKMTSHYAIDTEPTWSPDGRKIAFTSDRGGKPQIYEVPVSGGKPKRITFTGKYNARATYSPDGKSMAMVTQTDNGAHCIGVMDLQSGSLRVLTEGRLDESPSFAPNGSMIIYGTKVSGRGELAAVSVDGRVKQRLSLQAGNVREPDWAPFVK